jgi:hypothetical protein
MSESLSWLYSNDKVGRQRSQQKLHIQQNGKASFSKHTHRQQQILWLQISMSHLVFVAVCHCLEENLAGVSCFFLVVITLLHDTIEQLSSQHLFCDEIVELFLLKDIVKPYDIAVFQFGQNIDFILQSLCIFWSKLSLCHNLDSKRFPRLLVRAFLDNREGPRPKL